MDHMIGVVSFFEGVNKCHVTTSVYSQQTCKFLTNQDQIQYELVLTNTSSSSLAWN